MPIDDAELLRRFAKDHDELAFRELVARHIGLVHQTARRKLGGNEETARDISQQTFLALARKARSLSGQHNIAGWLYKTAIYFAMQSIRTEIRRKRREEAAAEVPLADSPPSWEMLAPVLDDALAKLNERDREAVILRFLENKSFPEVSEALAISPDAARMRVQRALEKLQPLLAERGVASTAAALALVMATPGVAAVPADLAAGISDAALVATATTAKASTLLSVLMTGKLKVLALVALVGGGVAIWAIKTSADAKGASAGKIQSVQTASQSLTSDTTSAVKSDTRHSPPLYRAPEAADTKRSETNTSVGTHSPLLQKMTPIIDLGNVGRASPREALATQLWAAHVGDVSLESQCLFIGPKAQAEYDARIAQVPDSVRQQYASPEQIVSFALSGSPRPVSAAEVLEEKQLDADTVTLRTSWGHENTSEVITNTLYFRRTDSGWKLVIGPSGVDRAISYLSSQSVPSLHSKTTPTSPAALK